MKRNGFTLIELLVIIVIVVVVISLCKAGCGVGGWGPTTTHVVSVTDKKIDISGGKKSTESHYMVYGTENGRTVAYEVDNGFLLGTWNADEIYAGINVSKTYEMTTEGNKRVNMFMQEYPYIVRAIEVNTNAPVKLEL